MATIQQIESAIFQLPERDFLTLLQRLREREQQIWDQQLERDVSAGKLDRFGEEALAEHRAGLTKPI